MYSLLTFFYFGDHVFGVIWRLWSSLWALFFVLLSLKREIGRFTGWDAKIEVCITCVISAYLLPTGVLPLGG